MRPRKRQSSVAVIDIGSNSVRIVVYESMTRSLVTLFNEKTLCGLGREQAGALHLAAKAAQRFFVEDGDEAPRHRFIDDETNRVRTDVDDRDA